MSGNKWKYVTIILSLSMFLAGCTEKPATETNEIHQLDEFFEQVSLPEELSIDVDFEQMSQVETVRLYTGETIDVNTDPLLHTLLGDKPMEQSTYPLGVIYSTDVDSVQESLDIMHVGRDTSGESSGINNAFSYYKTIGQDDPAKWGYVARPDFIAPNTITPNLVNRDYLSKADLGFKPYSQVVEDVFSIFQLAELPEFMVGESYSLDLETMKAHYQTAQELGHVSDPDAPMEWTLNDECYIFSLQQMIDALPVVNVGWLKPEGAAVFDSKMPITYVTLTYDQSGIRVIQAANLLQITSEGSTESIISGYDALKVLVDDYNKIILERDVRIVSAQLCYVLFPAPRDTSGRAFSLTPGWVLTSQAEFSDGHILFRYDVVDAITGELYPGRF